tara:strand:+ start:288 stop:884 length:597 start_codon:yes stop_codon:yes gene_type:complete
MSLLNREQREYVESFWKLKEKDGYKFHSEEIGIPCINSRQDFDKLVKDIKAIDEDLAKRLHDLMFYINVPNGGSFLLYNIPETECYKMAITTLPSNMSGGFKKFTSDLDLDQISNLIRVANQRKEEIEKEPLETIYVLSVGGLNIKASTNKDALTQAQKEKMQEVLNDKSFQGIAITKDDIPFITSIKGRVSEWSDLM